MSNTTFLDIDESLKMKNFLLPDKEDLDDKLDQLEKKVLEKGITRTSILVLPKPGVCIKTKTVSGEKIFVNLCTSDKIPPPEDISDYDLVQIMNNVNQYTIPLCIGTERMEKDKSNIPCTTFDVVINTTYLKKCIQKYCFMAFTVLSVLSGVAEKSNKVIDYRNYVVLKNRTVMGTLQKHMIQNRELQEKPEGYKPLIEVIPQSKKSVNKEVQDSDKVEASYILLKQSLDDPVESLIALFDMPKTVLIDDVMVLINSDRINVTDEKACCSHDVLLPYTVKKDSAKAYLDYNLKILRVDVLVQ